MTGVRACDLGGWQSRTTFVLALSASAVGLGNLWRFSYLAGEHGGAPFVITYVACLFLVAVPVMVAEVVVGSHGRGSPPLALRLAREWLEREGLDCELKCANITEIPWQTGTFDAVISCDNAVTHLMTRAEILDAFRAFRRSTRTCGEASR